MKATVRAKLQRVVAVSDVIDHEALDLFVSPCVRWAHDFRSGLQRPHGATH